MVVHLVTLVREHETCCLGEWECGSRVTPLLPLQLRIPPEQWLERSLYCRGDGTLSYFFSLDELRRRAEAAGFEVEEARYVCVINRNKKTGTELRRVFVHGLFRRPFARPDATR